MTLTELSPKRIILVTDNYLPHFSGHAYAVATWATKLVERGHNVLVVADSLDHRYAVEQAEVKVLRVPRWSFLPYGNVLASLRPKGRRLRDFLYQFEPELVHFHGYWPLCQQVAHHLQSTGIPFVASVHGLPQHVLAKDILWSHAHLWRILSRFYNRSLYISVPSKHVKQLLMMRGIAEEKLRLIPTGIDAELFHPVEEPVRQKIRQDYGWQKPVIAYVGRLSAEKNLADFSMLDSHDHHLLAIGEGSVALPAHIQRLPQQPRERLSHLLPSIDVLFLPSLTETQGLIVGEALAVGTPAVVPMGTAAAEWVKPGVNGALYQRGDAVSATKAIGEALLLDRQPIPGTMQGWSWPQVLARMETMYQDSL